MAELARETQTDAWAAFRIQPDEANFERFYEQTRRLTWTICRRMLRDEEDVADAFQAVYARALQVARDPGSEFRILPGSTLVLRLSGLESDALRKRRLRRARKEIPVDTLPDTPGADPPADQVAASNQLRQRLESLIEQLPETYRLPLLLHYFHGLTQREVAEALGRPQGSVSVTIARGLRHLEPLARQAGLGNVATLLATVGAGSALIEPPGAIAAGTVYLNAKSAAATATAAGALAVGGAVKGLGLFGLSLKAIAATLVTLAALTFAGIRIYSALPHDLPPPPPAPAPVAAGLSTAPILPDGSFNPLARTKRPAGADPAALAAADPWRPRYAGYLAAIPTRGASVAVYPFLDQTASGVGLLHTAGWQAVGQAALALLTNADVGEMPMPADGGLLYPDVDGRFPPIDVAGWQRRALDDPATSGSRIVVTGAYRSVGDGFSLGIWMHDREAGAWEPLFEETLASPADFRTLSDQQRRAARRLALQLAERSDGLDLAPSLPSPAGLDLATELSAIAAMLDSCDTWLVMDGIDRALQLAALLPTESTPLQAAAYGINLLWWSTFDWQFGSDSRVNPGLLAHGLAQAALILDTRPAMASLNWQYAARSVNHPVWNRYRDISGTDISEGAAELVPYVRATTNSVDLDRPLIPEHIAVYPHWWILRTEAKHTWFIGHSALRDEFSAVLPHWESQDLYLNAFVASKQSQYYRPVDEHPFTSMAAASTAVARASASAEGAALLLAMADDPKLNEILPILVSADRPRGLLGMLAGSGSRAERIATLSALVHSGDYYAIRRHLLDQSEDWRMPFPGDEFFRMIESLDPVSRQALKDSRLRIAPSGFGGFEFTPAARIEWMRHRESLAILLALQLVGEMRSIYDDAVTLMETYLDLRPEDNDASRSYQGWLSTEMEVDDARERFERVAAMWRKSATRDPSVFYNTALAKFSRGLDSTGNRFLLAWQHVEPFNYELHKNLGYCYRGYGYHRLAAEHFGRFIAALPRAYEEVCAWGEEMVEIGRMKDEGVRDALTVSATLMVGNGRLHYARLNYLLDWEQNYVEAREAVDLAHKAGGDRWLYERGWVEQEAGNSSGALDYYSQYETFALDTNPRTTDQRRAADAERLIDRYVELGALDRAQALINRMPEFDIYTGFAMSALGDWAVFQQDYPAAMRHYRDMIARYGPSPAATLGIARCLIGTGDTKSAIDLLEASTAGAPGTWDSPDVITKLMELYAQLADAGAARELMTRVTTMRSRSRKLILDLLETYSTLDPDDAARIRARLNEIMAGPPFEDKLEASIEPLDPAPLAERIR